MAAHARSAFTHAALSLALVVAACTLPDVRVRTHGADSKRDAGVTSASKDADAGSKPQAGRREQSAESAPDGSVSDEQGPMRSDGGAADQGARRSDAMAPSGVNSSSGRAATAGLAGQTAVSGEAGAMHVEQAGASGVDARSSQPDAGTSSTTEDETAAACAAVHSGERCHACDCAYCASHVLRCEMVTEDTQNCSRVAECALQNHCQGLACLCGDNLNTCQIRPLGPCLSEIREAAGTSDYYTIVAVASAQDTPLATAFNLIQCRADQCAETCKLQ